MFRGRHGERGVVHPRDHAPELLVHGSPSLADAPVDQVYGPLGDGDLSMTLVALVERDFAKQAPGRPAPASQHLASRVKRIEQLIGLDLTRTPDPRSRRRTLVQPHQRGPRVSPL